MFIEAIYRRERDPYVEYRYRIEITPGETPHWSARIWRSEDYLGTASGTVVSPPRDEILLKTLIEEEVREIIETRYSLF